MNNKDNKMGEIWLAETGNAMEYIFKTQKYSAAIDGRYTVPSVPFKLFSVFGF